MKIDTLKKSIKLNVFLNVSRTFLSIVFPIITFPYITRILGVNNVGRLNYTASIINFFTLISSLGINSYAIREGAYFREDKMRLSVFSSEILTLNIITSFFSYSLLLFFSNTLPQVKHNRLLLILQGLSFVFSAFGIEWVNVIKEDYIYITIRSIVIQVISIVLLFFLVRDRNDILIYIGIQLFAQFLITACNFFYIKKNIKLSIVISKSLWTHLKKSLVFFSNAVAVTIYVSSDTVMLGWYCGDYYVGIYSVATKIYTILKLMLCSKVPTVKDKYFLFQ